MANKKKPTKYEKVYTELLEFVINLHEDNKKRIRHGLFFLLIVPAILIIVRALTDGDKVVFLIIWIITMFLGAIYLISIEYLDESIKKKLKEIGIDEVEMDNLLESPRLRKKLEEFRNLKSKGGSK